MKFCFKFEEKDNRKNFYICIFFNLFKLFYSIFFFSHYYYILEKKKIYFLAISEQEWGLEYRDITFSHNGFNLGAQKKVVYHFPKKQFLKSLYILNENGEMLVRIYKSGCMTMMNSWFLFLNIISILI